MEMYNQSLTPSLEEKMKQFDNRSAEILNFLDREACYFYDGLGKTKFQRELREELINSTLHRCVLKLSEYDPNKGTLTTWASTIMHNIYIDKLREKSRQPVLDSLEYLEYDIKDSHFDPLEMIFDGYGLQEVVLEKIVSLENENQISDKDCLILREVLLNEKNYAEIARTLGITNGNQGRQLVRRHYLKALQLLRGKLAKETRFADLLPT